MMFVRSFLGFIVPSFLRSFTRWFAFPFVSWFECRRRRLAAESQFLLYNLRPSVTQGARDMGSHGGLFEKVKVRQAPVSKPTICLPADMIRMRARHGRAVPCSSSLAHRLLPSSPSCRRQKVGEFPPGRGHRCFGANCLLLLRLID